MIKVTELYVYPLKSAAANRVEKAKIDEFGLQNDRRWMLVDSQGGFLSQRQLPQMCLISVSVDENGLRIKLPGESAFIATVDRQLKTKVQVWGDYCQAYDCGDEAANLISGFLATSCRLVYFPDDEIRQVDLDYAKSGDKTGFSDGFPLLLIAQESLDDLNSRLQQPVSMTRFRPNIVVSGVDAFAEDNWKIIEIGGITMRVVKPCSRCSIPSVNPLTGKRTVEPVKTLRSYRMRDGKVYFGQNLIADKTGMLETGMDVKIIK